MVAAQPETRDAGTANATRGTPGKEGWDIQLVHDASVVTEA